MKRGKGKMGSSSQGASKNMYNICNTYHGEMTHRALKSETKLFKRKF